MQRYIIDQKNTNVEDFQVRDELIDTLKKRFTTYGYKQIRTSTFEAYDMYANIIGTVPKDEMIKVIDPSGKVLVLRPDVTIPLTRTTSFYSRIPNQRLFYVLDVFRESFQLERKESTQAGIECFGENSPYIDSEILMLAIHTLNDVGFKNFKLEIGHAGLFKELIQQIDVSEQQLEQLQSLIQSKNLIEIEPFLATLAIDEKIKTALKTIPMIYGDPETVIQQAKTIVLNDKMEAIVQNLIDIHKIMKDYGSEDAILFNLGLINNMDYYSGVIFQGFVGNVGKPVLMGGRYDHLGDQFGANIPAIGFAFEVDLLLEAMKQQDLIQTRDSIVDIVILYDEAKQKDALSTAYKLRDLGYQVLIDHREIEAKVTIVFEKEKDGYIKEKNQSFTNVDELLRLLKAGGLA